MKKSILLMSLLSGTAFMLPNGGIAYDIPTLTHTPKLEPTFEFTQLDKAYKTAGVCFLGIGDCAPSAGFDSTPSTGSGGGDESFDLDTTSQCLNEGFTPQSCNSVQTIDGVCPYNSAYGRGCKCNPGLISCPAGQVGVGDSCNGMYASCKCDPNLKTCSAKENGQGAECGGKYESCVCKPEYQYDGYNCTYPQSTSGDECGGKYTGCICPEGVDEGEFGCAEYYPYPCDSICKIAYSDNCHIRPDNTGDYGCEKAWEDCSSKCEKPYADNCRNKTAVTVPANATCSSTYSDCSSKCSGWSCNSGYIQSDNSCVLACQPYADETGCSYGTKSCSDGCGGTRTCCQTKCEANACASGCYTNISCSAGRVCDSRNSCGGCESCRFADDSCPSGYRKGDGCSCASGAKVSYTEAGSMCYKCCSSSDRFCFKCNSNDISNPSLPSFNL